MTYNQLKELRGRSASPAGNRLGDAFAIAGCSQTECAKVTGMTVQYITDVKSGRVASPTVASAHRFAAFFGCLIEDLFPNLKREAVA